MVGKIGHHHEDQIERVHYITKSSVENVEDDEDDEDDEIAGELKKTPWRSIVAQTVGSAIQTLQPRSAGTPAKLWRETSCMKTRIAHSIHTCHHSYQTALIPHNTHHTKHPYCDHSFYLLLRAIFEKKQEAFNVIEKMTGGKSFVELKRKSENTINNFNKNRKEEFADFEMAIQGPWSVRPSYARLHGGLFRFLEQWEMGT